MRNMDFWIRRIHSLLGMVAVGGFLLEHIYTVSTVMAGPAVFDKNVAALAAMPFLVPIEITFIGLPLAFHGIFGLIYALKARNNPTSYGYWNNWMFYLQRITAYIAFVFICYHVWTLRIVGKAMGGQLIGFKYMAGVLSDPIVYAVYCIGLLASIFHFTNGMWAVAITWGITVGPRAQRLVSVGTMGLFVLLSSVGLTALSHFVK